MESEAISVLMVFQQITLTHPKDLITKNTVFLCFLYTEKCFLFPASIPICKLAGYFFDVTHKKNFSCVMSDLFKS